METKGGFSEDGVQGKGVHEGLQNLVHLLGRLKLRPNNPKICFKNAILIQNENGRDLLIYSDHATQFQLPLNKNVLPSHYRSPNLCEI